MKVFIDAFLFETHCTVLLLGNFTFLTFRFYQMKGKEISMTDLVRLEMLTMEIRVHFQNSEEDQMEASHLFFKMFHLANFLPRLKHHQFQY